MTEEKKKKKEPPPVKCPLCGKRGVLSRFGNEMKHMVSVKLETGRMYKKAVYCRLGVSE